MDCGRGSKRVPKTASKIGPRSDAEIGVKRTPKGPQVDPEIGSGTVSSPAEVPTCPGTPPGTLGMPPDASRDPPGTPLGPPGSPQKRSRNWPHKSTPKGPQTSLHWSCSSNFDPTEHRFWPDGTVSSPGEVVKCSGSPQGPQVGCEKSCFARLQTGF